MILIYKRGERLMNHHHDTALAMANLAIEVDEEKHELTILKNRWGLQHKELSLDLLPKIVGNPKGKLDWV